MSETVLRVYAGSGFSKNVVVPKPMCFVWPALGVRATRAQGVAADHSRRYRRGDVHRHQGLARHDDENRNG